AFKTARRKGEISFLKSKKQPAKVTPAAGIPARRAGENHLKNQPKTSVRNQSLLAGKRTRREGEKLFYKAPQNQRAL
ncbi:MAG TPA: hypothetical protein DCS87_14755, partial [Rheinheimera sp.]|nr:hypothetical protein [Rheinheimera sp.]